MTVASASQGFFGPHLWHILILAAWVPTFGVIVLVQRLHEPHSASNGVGLSTFQPDLGCQAGEAAVRLHFPWCQWMALGSVCAAIVHFIVMPAHFAQSNWYGSFFLVAAIGQLAFAVGVVTRPTRPLLVAGIIAYALVITLWLVSRFIGVPIGPDNGATEPIGFLDVVASVAELFVLVFGILALRSRIVTQNWRWSQWSRFLRFAAPICVILTISVGFLAPRS
jgi:hypothetical protein